MLAPELPPPTELLSRREPCAHCGAPSVFAFCWLPPHPPVPRSLAAPIPFRCLTAALSIHSPRRSASPSTTPPISATRRPASHFSQSPPGSRLALRWDLLIPRLHPIPWLLGGLPSAWVG